MGQMATENIVGVYGHDKKKKNTAMQHRAGLQNLHDFKIAESVLHREILNYTIER